MWHFASTRNVRRARVALQHLLNSLLTTSKPCREEHTFPRAALGQHDGTPASAKTSIGRKSSSGRIAMDKSNIKLDPLLLWRKQQQ